MNQFIEKFGLQDEELDKILGGLEDPVDSESLAEGCSQCTSTCMIACSGSCTACTGCVTWKALF